MVCSVAKPINKENPIFSAMMFYEILSCRSTGSCHHKATSGILYHVTEDYDATLQWAEYQLIDDEGFPEKYRTGRRPVPTMQ